MFILFKVYNFKGTKNISIMKKKKNPNQGRRVGKKENKDAKLRADPETLHTPDPQDEMKGPVSSIMQNIANAARNEVSQEEADKEKEEDI